MAKKTYKEREIIENGQLYIVKVDVDTGDVIAKTSAKPRRDRSNYFGKGDFFTMHKRVCDMLETKENYNNLTFRLLFTLIKRIEFNNRISTFRQSELARILKTHQPKVSASLKVLEEDGIIKKSGYDYYFTPKFIRYVNDGNFAHLSEEEKSEVFEAAE